MTESILIFTFALFLVIRGATLATKHATKLAENFCLSKYVVGFIIVAFVSLLPETLILINSAIEGSPGFGLGTLFGSNIVDLTLVFAILIFVARRGIKIKSKILTNVQAYPFFLLLPLAFGLNGHYSRLEGALLIAAGIIFSYQVFKNKIGAPSSLSYKDGRCKNVFLLLFAMVLLLIGSHFVVTSTVSLALFLGINPILIGLLVVSLGTAIPELSFSLKSLKKDCDDLGIGDILGTVMIDATIIVGAVALINPFSFPAKIVYIAGAFMVVASFALTKFMRSGRVLSKKEGLLLLAFWVLYAVIEFVFNK